VLTYTATRYLVSFGLLKGIRGCHPVASLVPPAQLNGILSLTGFRRKLASVLARLYHLALLLSAILLRQYFSRCLRVSMRGCPTEEAPTWPLNSK